MPFQEIGFSFLCPSCISTVLKNLMMQQSLLYYVKELMNCMKLTFSNAMSESSHQSIDEYRIKFKGHSVLKQYLRLKPIKRGVKAWQRCDAKTGYIFDLNVYAGKTENDEFFEGTLGERAVIELRSTVRISDAVISFDQFFYQC